MMRSCAEVVRIVSSDDDPSVNLVERLQMQMHLAMCRHCSKYVRQLHDLRRAVRDADKPVPNAEVESARGRILEELSKK